MKRGLLFLFYAFYSLMANSQKVLPEFIPYTKAGVTEKIEATKFHALKLSQVKYNVLKNKDSLPKEFIVQLDTLRNTGGSMVQFSRGGKRITMLAFKQGPQINMFSVLNDSAGRSNDIQLTDYKDITNDKKNEVFIYYTLGSRRRLQIWETGRAMLLLDIEISDSKVQARKMSDNTPIGYTRDVKFFEKGFHCFDNRFLGACDENACPEIIQRYTQVFEYTPGGFVQVLGCCELNVAKSLTRAGLKSEYVRLRALRGGKDRCCDNTGSGLKDVLTLMGDSVNFKHTREYVTGFFGKPDEDFKELPPELLQYSNTPKENLAVLIYHWRGRHDYYYFIFSNAKLLHKGWYNAFD